MLLAIDVGNTSTVMGLFGLSDEAPRASWRISSNRERSSDEWFVLTNQLIAAAGLASDPLSRAIVSSVVPAITQTIVAMTNRLGIAHPLVMSSDLNLGISIGVEVPREVGTDRLVNGAAAFQIVGGPLVVVDLGTATKIDAVSASGEFLGGAIAPGIGLSLEALATRAARLYSVELKAPNEAIGKNTTSAVQSGVVLGHIMMIQGMVERVSAELGGIRDVLLTGGYSHLVADHFKLIATWEPDLTLRGLRMIHDRNS
jgi:type III pantothenate kinase